MNYRTEDEVRDSAKLILGFDKTEPKVKQGTGQIKVGLHLDHHAQWTMKKYRKLHPDKPLPTITPHVFRHTFCTNMANAGMDIKSLQYLMGHSDAAITMNVYAHASYARAEESMQKILQFKPQDKEQKTG